MTRAVLRSRPAPRRAESTPPLRNAAAAIRPTHLLRAFATARCASGTSRRARTPPRAGSARQARRPGTAGSENSVRSNSACSRIVGQQAEAQEDRRPEHRRQRRARRAANTTESPGSSRAPRRRSRPAARTRWRCPTLRRPKCAPIERAERKRNRAEQAFLHEPRLQRDRDRHQRRHRVRQDVGIGQHLGRLPPAEPAVRRVIEAATSASSIGTKP